MVLRPALAQEQQQAEQAQGIARLAQSGEQLLGLWAWAFLPLPPAPPKMGLEGALPPSQEGLAPEECY